MGELSNNACEFKDVTVRARMCQYGDFICSMCHKKSRVLILTIPRTKYKDGVTLQTEYETLRTCEGCRDKLLKAIKLKFPKD